MKRNFLLISFLILSVLGYSQSAYEQKIRSDIKSVTVFLTGGEVIRETKVKLRKGRNKLIYAGISTVIDSKSIQFSTEEGVDLVSVSTEMDYLTFDKGLPEIDVLKDELKTHNSNKVGLNNERDAYHSELQLLKANSVIKGTQQNLSADELKSMAEYYRTRIMELNKIISGYDVKIADLNQKINQANKQLRELNIAERSHSNQIVVIIDSENEQTINTSLKYIISNCGWQANYDLSAKDISGKINLKYKAKVYNNTGNNWKDVQLTLSTSNPSLSATAPVLDAWFLNNKTISRSFKKQRAVIVPQNRGYDKYYQNASTPQISQNMDGIMADGWGAGGVGRNNQSPVSFRTIEVPQISTEFEIAKVYSIPSDSKPYIVEIKEFELSSTFSYKAVPKLDRDAFLLANVVGWEKLNLISGPTNVYYSGTYVGQSYIDTRNVEDTLRLSFGRDNKVVIERKLLEEFSSSKVIGSNKKDTYTYEIAVKNNLSINLQMDLLDQIPISQDSDISVSVEDVSGAQRNEETGILNWKVNLKPGETVKYRISFIIKYPKDKVITVKKYRTVSCPSF